MRSGAGSRGNMGGSGGAAGGALENGWRGALRSGAAPADAVDLVSESDSEDSEGVSGSDQEDEPSWIQWFCSLRGNELFCEVDEDYIEDDFNLSGLSSQVWPACGGYTQACSMLIVTCQVRMVSVAGVHRPGCPCTCG